MQGMDFQKSLIIVVRHFDGKIPQKIIFLEVVGRKRP